MPSGIAVKRKEAQPDDNLRTKCLPWLGGRCYKQSRRPNRGIVMNRLGQICQGQADAGDGLAQ